MECTYEKTIDANGLMTYSEEDDRWYLDPCELSQALPFSVAFGCQQSTRCDCTQVETVFAF